MFLKNSPFPASFPAERCLKGLLSATCSMSLASLFSFLRPHHSLKPNSHSKQEVCNCSLQTPFELWWWFWWNLLNDRKRQVSALTYSASAQMHFPPSDSILLASRLLKKCQLIANSEHSAFRHLHALEITQTGLGDGNINICN